MAGEAKYFEAGRPHSTWVHRSPLQRHTQSPTPGVRSLPQWGAAWVLITGVVCPRVLAVPFPAGNAHFYCKAPVDVCSHLLCRAEPSEITTWLPSHEPGSSGLELEGSCFAALWHRSCWGFFVPKPAGLHTQFCAKLSSALHCFKSFSTGCMGVCNVL